jgi:hypothetical protein
MPDAGATDAPGIEGGASQSPIVATPHPADRVPQGDPLVTRSTYRMLILRGLTPTEAADLTAFMCGIPVGDVHWSLQQVNRLLFLRELARDGRFGAVDGEALRPH